MFSKCIHKAMNYNSPIINSVAMLYIINGFKTCNILDDDDVNCIITDITVF